MKRLLAAIGPAIIVAAVVLGPGSILTSSRVGAQQGLMGIPIIACAAVLMMAMVILSARLGALCEHSLCTELAHRLGRPVAVFIGAVLFFLVAVFQSSNNIAVVGGIEPLFRVEVPDKPGTEEQPATDEELATYHEAMQPIIVRRVVILGVLNLLIIGVLYGMRDVYGSVERLMKILIAVMVAAFVGNLTVAMMSEREFEPVLRDGPVEWLAILGLIGTTFSVGGAFYQAYLVKEKGWGIDDVGRGTVDSILSISILGLITCVVLLTSWRVFYGHPNPPQLKSVGDVAMVLEPVFGSWARIVFAFGILAGAVSSFLGNALIGGTVLSDSLGQGARLKDGWPLHYTTFALLTGFGVAAVSLSAEGSTVHLITIAQAATVLGLPAMAAALVYLGSCPDIRSSGKIPSAVMLLAQIGLVVACLLAVLTVQKITPKVIDLVSPPAASAEASPEA